MNPSENAKTNNISETPVDKAPVEVVQPEVATNELNQANPVQEIKPAEIVIQIKPSKEDPIKESVQKFMTGITQENYVQGMTVARAYKKEGSPEKCLDMIEALIRKGLLLFNNHFDVRLAVPYLRLGDVLLQNLEDQNELFGGETDKKIDEPNTNQSPDQNELSERDQEIKVAWENLELSRVILEKYLEKENLTSEDKKTKQLVLSDVYKRIGECENLKENFDKAQAEVQKSIQILENLEDKETNRRLGETYYLMSCIVSYQSKTESASSAKNYVEKSLQIMKKIEESIKPENKVQKEEINLVIRTMEEKVKDLEEEIKEGPIEDVAEIKKTIKQNAFNTTSSFPKSQLNGTATAKVVNLGTFGKGSSRVDENCSKKLREPASKILGSQKQETTKEVKKIQIDKKISQEKLIE